VVVKLEPALCSKHPPADPPATFLATRPLSVLPAAASDLPSSVEATAVVIPVPSACAVAAAPATSALDTSTAAPLTHLAVVNAARAVASPADAAGLAPAAVGTTLVTVVAEPAPTT